MKKLLLSLTFIFILSMSVLAKTHTADLVAPEQIEFTLAEHEDAIKYTLYIEEDGLFGFKILSATSTSPYSPKLTVTLLDKGTPLSTFTTEKSEDGDYNYYMLEGLKEGKYTLKIENSTKFGDVSYVADTNFTPWDCVETAKGSSHESATVMELGRKYRGGVMLSEAKDVFAFTMPKDGYAVLDLYSGELKFFTLYDENLNEIGVMDVAISEPDKMFETRCGLKKGSYYISVSPDEDFADPEYALSVKTYYDADFEGEYNNTHLTATPIERGTELRGNLFGYEDVDVYSFSIDEKSTVTAKLTDLYLTNRGHYDFSLLEADGTPIVTRTKCNTYSLTLELDKGDYHLAVSCPGWAYFTAFGYKIGVMATKKEPVSDNTSKEQFDDVSPNSWYAKDVLTSRNKGLIEGTGENNFTPMGNVTVAQAITMASRMYEKFSGSNISSLSGNGEKWYSSYVMYAIAAGIISPEDFEDYERNATRAEMAYIFAGVLKKADLPGITADELVIPDVDIDGKYYYEIQLLYKLDILNGVDESGKFLPENNVTRAESAVIMLRCANMLGI